MGKKYLETKQGSLEQSILGLWETAAELEEMSDADRKLQERKDIHEARPFGVWELAGKKFNLIGLPPPPGGAPAEHLARYVLVSQRTGKEIKLKAKTNQAVTAELVKKGYQES